MNAVNSAGFPASALSYQPELPIVDAAGFAAVRGVIESSFAQGNVDGFLKSLVRGGLRIRDFEAVLGKGLLGKGTEAQYKALGNNDQGQIRECYLRSLERVPAKLREKFLKLYAYY